MIVTVAMLAGFTGCTTFNPGTGHNEYDPVKTSQVKQALKGGVSTTITALLLKEKNDDVANYLRSIGTVFCQMRNTGEFSPSFLIGQIDKIVNDKVRQNVVVIALKNTVISLYSIFFEQRHHAELPPDKWPYHLADLFCQSIHQGLVDAGKTGVENVLPPPTPQ